MRIPRPRFLHFFVLAVLIATFVFQPNNVFSYPGSEPLGKARKIAPAQTELVEGLPTRQIIIKYRSSALTTQGIRPSAAEQMERLSLKVGTKLTYLREMSGSGHVLQLPEKAELDQVQAIANSLMTLPEVEYAVPDRILKHTMLPNDPRYADQWHYSAPVMGSYGINLPAAWDITTGSSVVVAVVDTGITNHADLSGRIVPGYDFISYAEVANDGGGRDDNPLDPGDWELAGECYEGSPAVDSSWHGTHVAGTIAANGNNGIGVSGVNWNAKILPVRVLGKCGGDLSDIIDGMRWASGLSVPGVPNNPNPAKVLNLSLGGGGTCDAFIQNTINEINAAGSTIVVAAGNSNDDAGGYLPASCNGVISVAATNRDGDRSYYSNYGSVVDISAPGGETYIESDGILSTLNTGLKDPVADTYAYYQGTSMAAPHVAGVASLLYALDPSLTPSEVAQILRDSVTNFPSGGTCNTSSCGSGIVNAAAALQTLQEPPPPSTCNNLLQDPGFEAFTPNPYWTEFSTNYDTPLCTGESCGNGNGTTGPHGGSVWGWMGGTEQNETTSLEQTVVIPTGKAALEFYFWLGSAASGSGADDVFTAKIDGTTLFMADATQTGQYSSYKLISVDASAYADGGAHTIQFGSVTTGQVVNFNLDDVALCGGKTARVFNYMPAVLKMPSPTPTRTPIPTPTKTPVPLAYVNVKNDTGNQLCFEVLSSGVGRKCYSGGEYYYGSFKVGTYTFKVTARCGSGSYHDYYFRDYYFGAGTYGFRYYCTSTSADAEGTSTLQSIIEQAP